jgi:choline dehydrogenase-like flavoprotein
MLARSMTTPPKDDQYTLVLVGSGFASAFFLSGVLPRMATDARVLVLERGPRRLHAERMRRQDPTEPGFDEAVVNRTPDKRWYVDMTLGGGSNCWAACTPRLLPSDFELHTRYGRGRDWPIGYGDLEPHYCRAERVMSIAGDSTHTPFERSEPYPLPPHRLSEPDRLLQKAYPDAFFVQPSARPTRAVGARPRCCASGICVLCPIDSKFTLNNGMAELWRDPRVTLLTGAEVERLEVRERVVVGVHYRHEGRERQARCDAVGLGASAIFNPQILLRSGITHPLLGKRLNEQIGAQVKVWLRDLDNFQGSTMITGHGYMLYDGEHRAQYGACLIETFNRVKLRPELGRWRQFMEMKLIIEDLPSEQNTVSVASDDPRPVISHAHRSEYGLAGLREATRKLQDVLAKLPVERVVVEPPEPTEYHVLGTTVMGDDPATSVIDSRLRHHALRNLWVLGGGAFPTCSPANPSLTISALSLRAAEAFG